MKPVIPLVCLIVCVTASATLAAETPKGMVATYDALADAILSLKQAEASFIRSLLEGHRHGAELLMKRGDYESAAAEMALFANEGDNAIGGIRKRLLEGGHHHHADAEAKGVYEPGYVLVTREAKQKILEAAATIRQSASDADRQAAWEIFRTIADQLLAQ
jgi:hypothetical protein